MSLSTRRFIPARTMDYKLAENYAQNWNKRNRYNPEYKDFIARAFQYNPTHWTVVLYRIEATGLFLDSFLLV